MALAGIAVNAAIILISTANTNLNKGMSVMHATVYAARRRVIPVLITTSTTIAGLFSLAIGLGGESLMWGPVATAIVWGLAFSTILTLFVIPLLYSSFTREPVAAMLDCPGLLPYSPGSEMSPLNKLKQKIFSIDMAEKGPDDFAYDPQLSALYNEGVGYLDENLYWEAIRVFEKAANTEPKNLECNLYAAHVLIMYMQKNGWDIGYSDRAKRFITRARGLEPNDERILNLQRILTTLEKSTDET